MIDLPRLRVFIAIAEAGGLAAAARRLRLSAPAVTRALAALEADLGARLVHRTTRQVRLTDVGERFAADARRILAELEEAAAAARGAHTQPQGELAVTAPILFGRMHLAPVLLDFLAEHPRVSVRTLFVDRVVHLMDEGFDLALRIAELPDSGDTAIALGHVRRVVVAAPAYLAAHGTPRTPADLAGHAAIGFSQTGGAPPWRFASPAEPGRFASPAEPVRMLTGPQPHTRLVVNAGDVAIAAARAGRGLTRALSYQVREDLEAGRLVRLLEGFEPPPIPVQLVVPEGRRAAAKVRAFVDFAAARLRRLPDLAAPASPRA